MNRRAISSPKSGRLWGILLFGLVLLVCLYPCLGVPTEEPEEPCVEEGPHYGTWTLNYCPSITNSPSVSPTVLCAEVGQAPTVPTVVVPIYQPGQKQRSITYDCPTTNATVEYASISYSVGSVEWDPELPGAVTNSFSSTAYVMVTSDDELCSDPGRVNIGSASWVVSCNYAYSTTNCTDGAVALTNAVASTNVCLGGSVNASVSQSVSNALVTITQWQTNACGNLDTNNCPPYRLTNSVPPTIISNWWVVSGPGGYSNSGSGLSMSFTPTNGGSGSVTFNVKYKNPTPCSTNEQTATASASFEVKTNCIVQTNLTNCLIEGSMRLTNGAYNTNLCKDNAASLSVSNVISNSYVKVTTKYTNACGMITTNCPDVLVTNMVPPEIVSNWWVATGPGTYSNSGSGFSATLSPTNGGSGSVTFNLKYKLLTPCTTNIVTVTPVTLPYNVIVISNWCVAATPTNRTRTTVGVGEQVNLSLVGAPAGTYTWSTSAGSVSPTNGTSTLFTAPSNAATTATITVSFGSRSCTKDFEVKVPSGIVHTALAATKSYAKNVSGSGMHISPIIVGPTNVSFYRVRMMEVGMAATNITGYFTNHPPASHVGHGADNPFTLSQANAWPGTWDHAAGSGFAQPWTPGAFDWPIPGVWWITGGPTNSIPGWTQHFSMDDTNGTFTITKWTHQVTRNTNDVYTTAH